MKYPTILFLVRRSVFAAVILFACFGVSQAAHAQYSASSVVWLDGGAYNPAMQVDDCSVIAAGMPSCGTMTAGGSYPASRFDSGGRCYVETTYGGGHCSVYGRTATSNYGSCWESGQWHTGTATTFYHEWVQNNGQLGQICPMHAGSGGHQYWNEEIEYTQNPGDAGTPVARVHCMAVAAPTGKHSKPTVQMPRGGEVTYRSGGGCAPTQPNLKAGNTTPTTATAGTPVSFLSVVSNTGSASAVTTRTRFQRATSSGGAGATNLGDVSTSAISGGASRSVSLSYTFPAAGTFYVRACADIQNVAAESNENDNCSAWRAVSVSAGATAPNLVASSITPNVVTSEATTFRTTITNNGTANAGATVTRFQRATSAAGAGATSLGNVSTSATNASASRAVTRSVTLTPGTWYLRACADYTNVVAESNESDNCGPWTGITVWPSADDRSDLTASAITPVTATPGQATTFSATVFNIGGAGTDAIIVPPGGGGGGGGGSYPPPPPGGGGGGGGGGVQTLLPDLKFSWIPTFLSQPEIAHAAQAIPVMFQRATSAAGANATTLGTTNMDTLAAGASRVITRSATLAAGTWYLRACADFAGGGSSYGVVLEGNEDNNCGPWTRVDVVATPPTVSCTVSPTSVTTGGTVTYQANPAGGAKTPFTWTPSSGSVSGTGATLTRTITTPGNHGMSVRASGTNTSHCPTVSVVASWCTAGAPELDITATPTRVRAGESVTIAWEAAGVLGEGATCTVTGTDGFSTTDTVSEAPVCSTSGSEVRPIQTQTTYTLRCGTAEARATVNVIPNFEEF